MYIKGDWIMDYIKEVRQRVDDLDHVNKTLLISIGYTDIPDSLDKRKDMFYEWLMKGYKEVEDA